jgi:hypothetical protein
MQLRCQFRNRANALRSNRTDLFDVSSDAMRSLHLGYIAQ